MTKNLLNEIYSEISYYGPNSESKLSENIYSLAFYRCLCMIDLYRTTSSDPWALLEILENYSLIFRDKYIFCMLQIVVSLTSGKYLYSLSPKFKFVILGLLTRAFQNFKRLEIKCLQLDTLGYLILDHAINFCAFDKSNDICIESSCLYASNRKDTWGLICQSLESQCFTSVIEFYEFYNRLEKSVHNISVETNNVKMSFIKLPLNDLIEYFLSSKIQKSLTILSYAFKNPIDNRDLSIFDSIDASGNLKRMILSLNFFNVKINFIINML